MKRTILCLVVILSQICACEGESSNNIINSDNTNLIEHEVTLSSTSLDIDSLKKEVVNKGDTNAYIILSSWGMDSGEDRVFFEDYIMATKYKYSAAYSNAFYSFLYGYEKYGLRFEDMDKNTKEWLLELLRQGESLGDATAVDLLKEYSTR